MNQHRVLVFELGDPTGHQLGYLEHLTEYWCARAIPGRLDILVTSAFTSMHAEFAAWCAQNRDKGITLLSIAPAEAMQLEKRRGSLLRWSLTQGRILTKWLEERAPDDCLMMCFDHFQPALILGMRPRRPVRLHGIYFRPMVDRALYAKTWKGRVEAIWREVLLKGSLRSPYLRTLFCLDKHSVPYIKELTSRVCVMALPDPVRQYDTRIDSATMRGKLGVGAGRVVVLLFGELSRRKGTFELLASLNLLAPEDARRVAVVMAGPIPNADKAAITSQVTGMKDAREVQVIIEDRFVPDHEIQDFFGASDIVIAPYQRHIGMSAVLVRAATAGKPIIGASHGLLGELIRSERLGVTAGSASAREIAHAIRVCLSQPAEELFDAASARAFAEFNQADNFTATIFGRLLRAQKALCTRRGPDSTH